ncbi:MAG: sugar transferase [Bacillota bacterium]|nr:sugar transferase [Bacillota bacterium]
MPVKKRTFYAVFVKRLLDILFALVLLIPSALVLLPAMLLIKLESGGSVFFVQKRPGKNGKPFMLYKLRSMLPQNPPEQPQKSDMERLTRLGRILRSLSIDELPQLFNILKGDMSFIGPRPLLMSYLPLYSLEQSRRHEVRPGISGWAQVNGRNALSWEEKFKLDVFYVDHLSFSLDLKIIWMTVKNVLAREGINQSEGQTMQPFTGQKVKDA